MFHRKHETHVEESIRLSEQAARVAERRAKKTEELQPQAVARPHHPECAYYRLGPGVCDCASKDPDPEPVES